MPPNPDKPGCPNCGCTLLPAISKSEPIGIKGWVRATCCHCGKRTNYYATQTAALFAWRSGQWDRSETTAAKLPEPPPDRLVTFDDVTLAPSVNETFLNLILKTAPHCANAIIDAFKLGFNTGAAAQEHASNQDKQCPTATEATIGVSVPIKTCSSCRYWQEANHLCLTWGKSVGPRDCCNLWMEGARFQVAKE